MKLKRFILSLVLVVSLALGLTGCKDPITTTDIKNGIMYNALH